MLSTLCFRNFECTLTAILPGLEQSLPHIFRFVLQLFYFSSTFLQLANSVMLLTVTILTILSNLPVSFFYLASILQINILSIFSFTFDLASTTGDDLPAQILLEPKVSWKKSLWQNLRRCAGLKKRLSCTVD